MRSTLNLLFIALTGIFFSCSPEPDAKELIDELVVATNYDPAVSFSSYSTYAMPTDTIGFISNKSTESLITASESTFPKPILSAIKLNLDSRGYTRVDKSQDPDLGINVTVVNDFNVFQQVIYPDYYGGYGSNYYSGYYGYNSWYSYPYINTYAYNTGVLIIEIVDLKNRTPDNKVKVIWDAYMGDVYSTIDRIGQSVSAVDQAFTQSPYIGK